MTLPPSRQQFSNVLFMMSVRLRKSGSPREASAVLTPRDAYSRVVSALYSRCSSSSICHESHRSRLSCNGIASAARTSSLELALLAHCGKPSYFITFTCNPQWPQICVPVALLSAVGWPEALCGGLTTVAAASAGQRRAVGG